MECSHVTCVHLQGAARTKWVVLQSSCHSLRRATTLHSPKDLRLVGSQQHGRGGAAPHQKAVSYGFKATCANENVLPRVLPIHTSNPESASTKARLSLGLSTTKELQAAGQRARPALGAASGTHCASTGTAGKTATATARSPGVAAVWRRGASP